MNKFSRTVRHLTTTQFAAKCAFPSATLHAIQKKIAKGEGRHRAEIRLIVEPALELSAIWQGLSSRERAHELFSLYRIWDTEENCGVLVYINLADHQIEIIADRGIARLVPHSDWHAVCTTMTSGFARGKYHDSVLDGLLQLNTVLEHYFPEENMMHPQPNQLSNQAILL